MYFVLFCFSSSIMNTSHKCSVWEMSGHCPGLANTGCFILSSCITTNGNEAEILEADKNLF